MNLKALIVTLFLGSSSLALAEPYNAPVDVRDHRAPIQQPTVVDHRYEAPAPAPAADRRDHEGDRDGGHEGWKVRGPSWQTLASSDSLTSGRAVLRLPGTQLTQLKLQATAGRTSIGQVTIKFANGRSQVVSLNQMIGNGTPSLTIDLNGGIRQVKSIVVTGRSNRKASFEILGA